ncbi:MAG: membrane protein insertion efficiency factor YidD [Candidatus Omnitrophica bacterium]|nr:membrane protein insertion efficiency factor YidD [Candidatus Omnitrophota bacterium]
MRKTALFLLNLYSKFSKAFPATCKFYPTCSKYACDAFRVHPFFKAFKLTLLRLLRCNPFSKGGYDPLI